jgi:hypothetical protein
MIGVAEGDLPDTLIFRNRVKPPSRKTFRFFGRPNRVYGCPVPLPTGGAYRHRHGRGKRDAMDARPRARRTRGLADGEVAWSRPPDAGVKWVEMIGPRRGLSSPAPRGEREISRKPSRRECRSETGEPVVNYARVPKLFRTRGCGCNGHPAFPAPSCQRRAFMPQPGRYPAAGTRRHILCSLCRDPDKYGPEGSLP